MKHLLLGLILIAIICCNKEPTSRSNPPIPPSTTDSPLTPTTPTTPPKPTISVPPFLYICGDTLDNYELPTAVYWNDNSMTVLPNASHASGSGIALLDTNVYVSCSGTYLGNNVTYWRNGTAINTFDVSLTYPTVNAVTVSGTDVYFAGTGYINGFTKIVPLYWKNKEQAIKIPTSDQSHSFAQAIAVSGNDIYVAGSTADASLGYGIIATYWKNSVPTYLRTSSATSISSIANSIFISGSDVYVAGNIDLSYENISLKNVAVYWKNGNSTFLTTNVASVANSITISDGNIYVAGGIVGEDRLTMAAYWKNGVPVILDSTYSIANSIAVNGNDIYVAGKHGHNNATYWKNGQSIPLGKGMAYSIAIKK